MKFALDSNIILYFEGVNDEARRDTAHSLVDIIGVASIIIPIQALAESVHRLSRAPGWTRGRAVEQIKAWFGRFNTQDVTRGVYGEAQLLCAAHGLHIFDSVIVASANAAGASILLSEDMQDGFMWQGVTVMNPFAQAPNPLIRSILSNNMH